LNVEELVSGKAQRCYTNRHRYCSHRGSSRNHAKLWTPLHPAMSKFSGSIRTFIRRLPAEKLLLHTGQAQCNWHPCDD